MSDHTGWTAEQLAEALAEQERQHETTFGPANTFEAQMAQMKANRMVQGTFNRIQSAGAQVNAVPLDEVDDTLQAREASHGPYRQQAQMSQLLKAIMHGHPNWKELPAEHREALDMIMMKISRLLNGNSSEPDTWIDISGYAMLCYNLITTGSHLK